MASSFSSKIGVLLAAAGSAIGLGSIWKFPYEVGENGGGAFLLLYIVCSLLFGLPLVMNEFLVGKLSGKSAYGAYRELSGSNKWQWMSWTNVICVAALMSFYFVVTGWCIYYMVEAGAGACTRLNRRGEPCRSVCKLRLRCVSVGNLADVHGGCYLVYHSRGAAF